MQKRSLFGLATGALAVVASSGAAAHHGWSGQETTQSELSGTVHSPVDFAGPHATMQIRDASGRIWDLTLSPPSRTRRAGLEEDTIPVGAPVTVRGNRNSNPDRFEMKTVRVTYDGQNFDVYPSRN
jgi:hypothetical protein